MSVPKVTAILKQMKYRFAVNFGTLSIEHRICQVDIQTHSHADGLQAEPVNIFTAGHYKSDILIPRKI